MDASDPNSNPRPSLQTEAQRLADAARERASGALDEFKIASNQVVDKVRELIEDANVKRVLIKREDKVLLEIPLTVGVGAGAAALLLNPVLSAVGALAALVSDVTIAVERVEGADAAETVSNVNAPSTSSGSGGGSGSSGGSEAEGTPDKGADDKTVGRPSADA